MWICPSPLDTTRYVVVYKFNAGGSAPLVLILAQTPLYDIAPTSIELFAVLGLRLIQ